MIKKIILLFLISFLLFFINPEYNELNNLSIINKITVRCDTNTFYIKLYEIIPKKSENGITYKRKVYESYGNDFENIIKKMNHSKKFYYKKAIIDNYNCSEDDLKLFLNKKTSK